MFSKKPFSILYIDSDSFTYFAEGNIELKFTYPSASIKALDIIDEQFFVNEAIRFIQSNKIIPTTMMLVLSEEVVYEKEFEDQSLVTEHKKEENIKAEEVKPNTTTKDSTPNSTPAVNPDNVKQEADKNVNNINETLKANVPVSAEEQRSLILEERSHQIQSFIDIVPFEEVASKIYKKDKKVKIVATNKRLYETLVKIFTKQMFIIDSVIPVSVLGKDIISDHNLNKENANKLIKKFETLRQYSLFEENSYSLTRAATEPHGIQMNTKVTSKREYVLIGVFLCLISVLGIISYTTFFSPAKDRKIASISEHVKPSPIIVPTVIPTDIPVSTESAEFIKETVRIQISGGTTTQANLLQNAFLDSGYLNVIADPNNTASTGRVILVFSPLLPPSLKEEILLELRKSVLNVTVQESALTDFDVIINL